MVKNIMCTALEIGSRHRPTETGFLPGLHLFLLVQNNGGQAEAKFYEPVSLIRELSCLMLHTLAVQGQSHRIGSYATERFPLGRF